MYEDGCALLASTIHSNKKGFLHAQYIYIRTVSSEHLSSTLLIQFKPVDEPWPEKLVPETQYKRPLNEALCVLQTYLRISL